MLHSTNLLTKGRELLATAEARERLGPEVCEQADLRLRFRIEDAGRGVWPDLLTVKGQTGAGVVVLECIASALVAHGKRSCDPMVALKRVRTRRLTGEEFLPLTDWAREQGVSPRAVQWFQWKLVDVILGTGEPGAVGLREPEAYLTWLAEQAAGQDAWPQPGVAESATCEDHERRAMRQWFESFTKGRWEGKLWKTGRVVETNFPRRQRIEMYLREALDHMEGRGSPPGLAFFHALRRTEEQNYLRWLKALELALSADGGARLAYYSEMFEVPTGKLACSWDSEKREFSQLRDEWTEWLKGCVNFRSAAMALGLDCLDLGSADHGGEPSGSGTAGAGPSEPATAGGGRRGPPPFGAPETAVPSGLAVAGGLVTGTWSFAWRAGVYAVVAAAVVLPGFAWLLNRMDFDLATEISQAITLGASPSSDGPTIESLSAKFKKVDLLFGAAGGVVSTGAGSELVMRCRESGGGVSCKPVPGRQPPGSRIPHWLFEPPAPNGGPDPDVEEVSGVWGDPKAGRVSLSPLSSTTAVCPVEASWCNANCRVYSAEVTYTNGGDGTIAICVDVPFDSKGGMNPSLAGFRSTAAGGPSLTFQTSEECNVRRNWTLVPSRGAVTQEAVAFFCGAPRFGEAVEIRAGFSAEPPNPDWLGSPALSVANETAPAYPFPSQISWPFVLDQPVP